MLRRAQFGVKSISDRLLGRRNLLCLWQRTPSSLVSPMFLRMQGGSLQRLRLQTAHIHQRSHSQSPYQDLLHPQYAWRRLLRSLIDSFLPQRASCRLAVLTSLADFVATHTTLNVLWVHVILVFFIYSHSLLFRFPQDILRENNRLLTSS
jgi:hypothetical protein